MDIPGRLGSQNRSLGQQRGNGYASLEGNQEEGRLRQTTIYSLAVLLEDRLSEEDIKVSLDSRNHFGAPQSSHRMKKRNIFNINAFWQLCEKTRSAVEK